jgi:ABC-type antimicrobial peptide transport system permease subunit
VTIVGVVGDVHYRDLTTPLATTEPDVYFPIAQRTPASVEIAVRADLPPESVAAALRRELAALDRTIPLFSVEPLETTLAQQTASGRFASTLLAAFGAAALVLSAIGLYGTLSFLVGTRRRELGIRLALGATPRDVLSAIVGHGVGLAAIGVAVGVAASLVLTRWVASQLYHVTTHDPLVLIAVPMVLLLVSVGASWIPARRAAAVDPQIALRAD